MFLYMEHLTIFYLYFPIMMHTATILVDADDRWDTFKLSLQIILQWNRKLFVCLRSINFYKVTDAVIIIFM